MAANKLNILEPSVNNMCVRVFVRAAGLDFEEENVWGKTTSPEFGWKADTVNEVLQVWPVQL